MEPKQILKQKIKGVLIGCAMGDAMGMPTECWSQRQIKNRYPAGVRTYMESPETAVAGRKMQAGSVTDDTINTVMVLNSIVELNGKLDARHYVNKLAEWDKNSEISEYVSGPSTRRALDKIAHGIPIEEAGREGTTNGASMKISPIGIISDYRNMEELIDHVYQICMPTHNTNIALSGACAVAAAVSYALSPSPTMEGLWQAAVQAVQGSQGKGFDYPSPSLLWRMERARKIVKESARDAAITRLYEEIGTGMETIETIPAVFAVVELANGDPREAAVISANIGGDTDTIGAISAAICGGMKPEFDPEETAFLERVNHLDFDGLAEKILPYGAG